VDVADPAAFLVIAQHDLRDREADQFTVGELGPVATTGARRDDVVVDQHVECGEEGVQVFRHRLIMNTLLLRGDTSPPHMIFTASII
jgi:hypothetical protein